MKTKYKFLIYISIILIIIIITILSIILINKHKQKQLNIEKETLLEIGTNDNPITEITSIDFNDYVNRKAYITANLLYPNYSNILYKIPKHMTDLTIESMNDKNIKFEIYFEERYTDFNLNLKNIHISNLEQFITSTQYNCEPEFTLNINFAGENILHTPYTEGYESFRCYLINLNNIDIKLNAIEDNSKFIISSANGLKGKDGINGKHNQMKSDDAKGTAGENGSSGLSLLYCKSFAINTNNYNTSINFIAGNGGNGGNGGKGGTYYVIYPLIKDKGMDGNLGRGGKGGICIYTNNQKIIIDNKEINLKPTNENFYISDMITIQDGTNGKVGEFNK